jgi:DNA-binding response OmpR family regulator
MLPEKTGLELCKDLRNAHIQTPILILTAKGQTQDKVKGLDTGADDYMTKPFSFEELLARVRALVRRPKILVDSTLTVSDLTLDTSTFTVTRHHKKIQLTGKEYNLLEYLMRHTPQTLSKDQIIAHVWDYHADILPNTVEVTIRNLRKKIDNSFPSKKTLIRTVRGFGYAIGA